MAVSPHDIEALETAINSGARRVTYSDGSEVEYRTLAEMRSILTGMRANFATTKPVRAFRGAPRSGY